MGSKYPFYIDFPHAIILIQICCCITFLSFKYFLGPLTNPTFRMFIQKSEKREKENSESERKKRGIILKSSHK